MPDPATQFLEAAKDCETVAQVARKLGWNMESLRHFNETTGANLPFTKEGPPKPRTPGVACPKAAPVRKGGKGE